MLKKLYRRITALHSFLHSFLNSPEYREWRGGTMSLDASIRAWNDREQREHEAEMDRMRRQEWAFTQRILLTEEKCRRLGEAILLAPLPPPTGVYCGLRALGRKKEKES